MDWSHGGMGSEDSVGRVPAEGQRGTPRVLATRACGFSVPRPVPLFSLKPVPSPHLVRLIGVPLSQWLEGVGKRTVKLGGSLRS